MAIKKIHLSFKHNDLSDVSIMDENDNAILEHNGYMLEMGIFIDQDQTVFVVDNETGKIIGWVPITEEDVKRIKEEESDDA
jgi:hypothetical protein